jgi:hypothetical protein
MQRKARRGGSRVLASTQAGREGLQAEPLVLQPFEGVVLAAPR